jgi:hypothetical protein
MQRQLNQLQVSAAEQSKLTLNLSNYLSQTFLYLLQSLIHFIIAQRPANDPLNVWPAMCASLLEVPLYGVATIARDGAVLNSPYLIHQPAKGPFWPQLDYSRLITMPHVEIHLATDHLWNERPQAVPKAPCGASLLFSTADRATIT